MMASRALANVLEATGFRSGGQRAEGLLLGKEARAEFRGRSLRPDAVWVAKSRLRIYFKEVPSEPRPDDVARWHRDAWNHGFAPLLWVVSPHRIDLYNGFARPSSDGSAEAARLRTFERIDSELSKLDAIAGRLAMETGAFWTGPLAEEVDRNGRVDQQLLSDLAVLEGDLLDNGLPRMEAQALIGRSIFVQFLIDRRILDISGSLAVNLRTPDAAHRLFSRLSTFNGDMFPRDATVPEEKHLCRVADFLDAVDPKTGQTTLFPYQFDVIPVEVVSSIYEQFAQAASAAEGTSTDVFYTPVPLVSMVLDEIMDGLSGRETVLDLTCGSAVFLVEALRRLVRCRAKNEVVTGELVRTVLQEQIFGIDISEAAVRVAAFSLYLAQVELDPDLAALKLDLDGLEASLSPFEPLIDRNLIVGDAWDEHEALTVDGKRREFDLVVGNPPWSDPGKEAREERRSRVGAQSVRSGRGDSINFAYRALDFAAPHARIGLVLSASQFFAKAKGGGLTPAQELVELESLSPVTLVNLSNLPWLFSKRKQKGKLPALVLFARHRKAPSGTITTVQVPWSRSTARAATIEMAPSDVLAIARSAYRRNRDILKAAFLGNRRDLALLERLGAEHGELKDELHRFQTAMRAGIGGVGLGSGDVDALQGLPFLDNDAWEAASETYKDALFALPPALAEFEAEKAARPRKDKDEIFRAPLVLVKEFLSMSPRPVVLMADSDLVYSDAFHGVAFSNAHLEAGAILAATLQSGLAAWFLLMTSTDFGTSMRRIKIRDLEPFPATDLLASPKTEQGRRIVTMVRRLRRRKTIREADRAALDEAVFDLYGLQDQERIVIRDGLVRATWQWEAGRDQSVEEVSTDQLDDYASVFLEVMDDWLKSAGRRRMRAEIFDLGSSAPLRIVRFVLEKRTTRSPPTKIVTPRGNLREVMDRIGDRLRVRLGDALYGQRELRAHGPSEVVLIKPSAYRHWMGVCALEDADAVVAESWTGRQP